MGMEVANATDVLGQFASGSGYSDLIAAIERAGRSCPILAALVCDGYTENVEKAVVELRTLAKNTEKDVATTATALADLIDGQEMAIVTDGTSEEEEDVEKEDEQTADPLTGTEIEKIDNRDFELSADIIKLDSEQQLVFGWFSVVAIAGKPVTDTQGDVISAETLEQSAYEFVLTARKAGEMHDTDKSDDVVGVGRLVESVVFTKEKQEAMLKSLHDQDIDAVLDLGCVAWWGGFRVSDPATWKRIKVGELRAFSIGGKGRRQKIGEGDVEKYREGDEDGHWVTIDDNPVLISGPRPDAGAKPDAKPDVKPEAKPGAGDKPKTANPEGLLSSAKVVSQARLGGGISVTKMVTLEGGVRAVFKPASGEGVWEGVDKGKGTEREIAAWEVAKIVGMGDLVAPAVERTIDGKRGALLLWLPGKFPVGANKYDGKDGLARAAMFDSVLGNKDRHSGNWKITNDGKLALYDHNLAFSDRGREASGALANEAAFMFGGRGAESPGKSFREYARPYLKNREKILGTLRRVGIPEGAIERTAARIDRLSAAKDWNAIT